MMFNWRDSFNWKIHFQYGNAKGYNLFKSGHVLQAFVKKEGDIFYEKMEVLPSMKKGVYRVKIVLDSCSCIKKHYAIVLQELMVDATTWLLHCLCWSHLMTTQIRRTVEPKSSQKKSHVHRSHVLGIFQTKRSQKHRLFNRWTSLNMSGGEEKTSTKEHSTRPLSTQAPNIGRLFKTSIVSFI